jgi:hypothetical protein
MPAASQPVKIFFSYAHEDEAMRDELAKHLKPLRRDGAISTWHDRCLTAGREWAGEIDRELETADIILLLISIDFLSSDYIDGVELTRAMARHEARSARVIPVILRPCLWQRSRFAKLNPLPTDGKPVKIWRSSDAAFCSIAEGIIKTIHEIAGIGEGTSESVEKTTQPIPSEELVIKEAIKKISEVRSPFLQG